PHVRKFWEGESHRRLVEPFCGGLAVALGLKPQRALLNYINPHLFNFYCWVQRGLRITIELKYEKTIFYRHRSRFNELLHKGTTTTKEAASLFYYLNRTCFNGLCRFNRSGEFNVPFGQYKSVNYGMDFAPYQKMFRSWNFTSFDLEKLPIERNDFIYADPPYDVEFTTYSAGGFSWDDQISTAEFLGKHRGPVLLSNQATPHIVRLHR